MGLRLNVACAGVGLNSLERCGSRPATTTTGTPRRFRSTATCRLRRSTSIHTALARIRPAADASTSSHVAGSEKTGPVASSCATTHINTPHPPASSTKSPRGPRQQRSAGQHSPGGTTAERSRGSPRRGMPAVREARTQAHPDSQAFEPPWSILSRTSDSTV